MKDYGSLTHNPKVVYLNPPVCINLTSSGTDPSSPNHVDSTSQDRVTCLNQFEERNQKVKYGYSTIDFRL